MKCSRLPKLLFPALLVSFGLAPAFGAPKRAWTPEDSFALKRVGELQLSPRGDRLLFVVSETAVSENRRPSGLWSLPVDGTEPVALTDPGREGASSPRWSPDGQRIAYFGGGGLWVMAADGSNKKKLADVETSNAYLGSQGNSLSWSPDGTRLAYAAAGPRYYPNDIDPPHLPTGNEVMIIERLLHKAPYFYSDLRRTQVFTLAASGGPPRQISAGDFDYHSISWSPDGEWIVCVSNQTGRDDFNANNDLVLLSTTGAPMKQLTGTVGPEYEPIWSPDGSRIAYHGRLRAGRSKESDAELKKLYTLPARGGRAMELSAPLDRWVGDFSWSSQGKTVYFTVQNQGRQELYSAPAEGGPVTALVTDPGQVGSFAVEKDGKAIYYVFTDLVQPDEIFRLDVAAASKTQLTRVNHAFTQSVEIPKAEALTYPSFDGLEIQGWLLKPHGFDPGKKYPLILDVHGGPHAQYGYSLPRIARLQELAGAGYAVLFTNPRGSSGRGQSSPIWSWATWAEAITRT
jgi:dipeptidyl aminopeptidase/acylaminoacyl peptidase